MNNQINKKAVQDKLGMDEKKRQSSLMPITWNQATSKWDVKDKSGQVKWSANKYVDAVTFTEDYNN